MVTTKVEIISNRRQLLLLVVGLIVAAAFISCTESGSESPRVQPTATFSPADATATWDAFRPELDRLAAEARENQIVRETVTTATAQAESQPPQVDGLPRSSPGTDPTAEPTLILPTPVPQRAIATGPVNRIAFSDGAGSIFTVSPDGSGLVTVAQGSPTSGAVRYTFPVWSPDGGSLVFSSFVIVANAVSQSALHRADADGDSGIVTLAIDNTSQSGVGPGVPHFSAWSPNGDQIALTTSGEFGIGSMLLGSHTGESPKGIALGAPLYINWAPDGNSILIHQDAGLHIIPVDGLTSGTPAVVGNGSISFNSPSWSPDSQSFAHVERVGSKASVVLTRRDDPSAHEVIADADTRVGLGWSPDGTRLAIARSSGASFHTLSLIDVETSVEQTIFEGEVRAFWWSPDGTKLTIIEDSPVIDFAHLWSVINVETGDVTPLVTQIVSDQFLFVQVFFDQYAESHNVWSPDSTKIVISGALLDAQEVTKPGGAIDLPETFESQIWVVDVVGVEDPVGVGRGTIASWSPR